MIEDIMIYSSSPHRKTSIVFSVELSLVSYKGSA